MGGERKDEVAHAVRAVHMRLGLWALVVIAMISSSPVDRAGIELELAACLSKAQGPKVTPHRWPRASGLADR